jgi:hypothetical protein
VLCPELFLASVSPATVALSSYLLGYRSADMSIGANFYDISPSNTDMQMEEDSSLLVLPDELLIAFLAFLPGADLARYAFYIVVSKKASCFGRASSTNLFGNRLSAVNRRLNSLANDENLWKELCLSVTHHIRLSLTGGVWRQYWVNFLRDATPINRILVLSDVRNTPHWEILQLLLLLLHFLHSGCFNVRILFLSQDADVFTCLPDGSNIVHITSDSNPKDGSMYSQVRRRFPPSSARRRSERFHYVNSQRGAR